MVFRLPPNGSERYVELLTEIQNMFRAVAEHSIKRRIREEQQGLTFSEEHATECAKLIRNAMLAHDGTRVDADRFAREAKRRLLREDPQSKSDRTEADDEEFIYNLTMLLLTWHTLLVDAATGEPLEMVLDASDFDDDMLPRRLSSDQLSLIDENLSQTVVAPDEFRRYLRFVAGQHADVGRLPRAMVELLSLDGIAVRER